MPKSIKHPFDMLITAYKEYGWTLKFEFDFVDGFRSKRAGKGGSRWHFHRNPVTELRDCCLCGRVSTPKKISERSDVFGWNRSHQEEYEVDSKDILCVSCWNKVKPIVKRQKEAESCKKLINQLTWSISNERKNQNNRKPA